MHTLLFLEMASVGKTRACFSGSSMELAILCHGEKLDYIPSGGDGHEAINRAL